MGDLESENSSAEHRKIPSDAAHADCGVRFDDAKEADAGDKHVSDDIVPEKGDIVLVPYDKGRHSADAEGKREHHPKNSQP